jgi:hypothetical protein
VQYSSQLPPDKSPARVAEPNGALVVSVGRAISEPLAIMLKSASK